MSLVETLIAAGLALVVMGIVAQLVYFALKTSKHGALKAELQQRASILNSRLDHDLRSTSSRGVISSAQRLSIHPRRLEFGSVLWRETSILYLRSEERLTRDVVTLESPVEQVLELPDETTWSSHLGRPVENRQHFDGVVLFEVNVGEDRVASTRFEMVAEHGKVEYKRRIFLRQGG